MTSRHILANQAFRVSNRHRRVQVRPHTTAGGWVPHVTKHATRGYYSEDCISTGDSTARARACDARVHQPAAQRPPAIATRVTATRQTQANKRALPATGRWFPGPVHHARITVLASRATLVSAGHSCRRTGCSWPLTTWGPREPWGRRVPWGPPSWWLPSPQPWAEPSCCPCRGASCLVGKCASLGLGSVCVLCVGVACVVGLWGRHGGAVVKEHTWHGCAFGGSNVFGCVGARRRDPCDVLE